MIRRGNYRAHFPQRLGIYSAEEKRTLAAHSWTWIQSISVGETLLALKLAAELRRQQPEIRIILSTTTTTGFQIAQQNAAEWLVPLYNPLDLKSVVRRALRHISIERLIVIEGGIWPNLALECFRRGAPLILAAARLSPRSEQRFYRFRHWISPLLRLFDLISVPGTEDRIRWERLGLDPQKIQVTGSIKFDESAGASSTGRVEEFRALVTSLGVAPSAPVLVAGSTFPGEETLLAQALLTLRSAIPDLFLILVPRHVERTATLLRELASVPLPVVVRSTLSPSSSSSLPAILLVDTTGELRDWYALATVVFVGKSLTAIGGQNPAEPAVLGKPIVFGPHMENFSALAQHLIAEGAAMEVAAAESLASTLLSLLNDPERRAQMSAAGPAALTSHRGATARTASHILKA